MTAEAIAEHEAREPARWGSSDADPGQGFRPVTDVPAPICRNCGAEVTTPFCGACGQGAHVHRSLAAIGHDALHGVLHVEGRVWRTLGLLARRPGVLTRRYIDGQRARYVGPFALFLFALFAAYVALTSVGAKAPGQPLDAQERALLADHRDNLARLEARRRRLEGQPAPTTLKERETLATIAAKQAIVRTLATELAAREADAKAASGATRAQPVGGGGADEAVTINGRVIIDAEKRGRTIVIGAPRDANDGGPARATDSSDTAAEQAMILQWYWLDELAAATDMPLFARIGAKLRTNPGLYAYKLQTTAYKYGWALIPLSLPLMALLFVWRRLPLYDHYVFVGYSMAWMLTMIALASLLGALPGGLAIAAAVPLLAMPWHLYRQLRDAYALGRLGALSRAVVLAVGALTLVVVFALALVGAGAIG